jgi:hypothetical protein
MAVLTVGRKAVLRAASMVDLMAAMLDVHRVDQWEWKVEKLAVM